MPACPSVRCVGRSQQPTHLVAHEIWPWRPHRFSQTEYMIDRRANSARGDQRSNMQFGDISEKGNNITLRMQRLKKRVVKEALVPKVLYIIHGQG